MNIFEKKLNYNEKILYQGKANPGKGAKNIIGLIVVIVFCLLIQILLIVSAKFGLGDGKNGINFSFILFFIIALLFELLCLYSIVNNLFLKKNNLKETYYCITNQRALRYDAKKDKLIFGYLYNYEKIISDNIKDNYGDVFMQIKVNETGNSKNDIKNLGMTMINRDPQNMPIIVFESVENPNEIKKLIKKTRNEIMAGENNEYL